MSDPAIPRKTSFQTWISQNINEKLEWKVTFLAIWLIFSSRFFVSFSWVLKKNNRNQKEKIKFTFYLLVSEMFFKMAPFHVPDAILSKFTQYLRNSTRVWQTNRPVDWPTVSHTLLKRCENASIKQLLNHHCLHHVQCQVASLDKRVGSSFYSNTAEIEESINQPINQSLIAIPIPLIITW